jgi:hypothetical protein
LELYPPCLEVSGRILAALKHVLLLAGTGQGKLLMADRLQVAANTLKCGMNYRCAWARRANDARAGAAAARPCQCRRACAACTRTP